MSQRDTRSLFGKKKQGGGGGDDKTKIVLFEYFIASMSILQYMVNWLKLF